MLANSTKPGVLQDAGVNHSSYCPACTTMFSPAGLDALWSEAGYEHLGATTCASSAARGCRLCGLILEAASWGYRDAQTVPLVFKAGCMRAIPAPGKIRGLNSGGDMVEVPMSFDTLEALVSYNKGKGSNMFNCRLAVFSSQDDPLSKHFPGRPLVQDMTSEVVVKAASGWLRDCQYGHPECGEQHQKPFLPTRVLDVGSGGNEQLVRLHVSAQDQRDEYLALSYCWGGPQPLVTTTENLAGMKDWFSLSELPKTLRDAVDVTRSMGIRYLWIDALCILQDSAEDKGREIQNMGQVYMNASATIIAGASRSAGEGFLKGQGGYPTMCKLSLTTMDSISGLISICRLTMGEFDSLPLSKRAWCFQEYILSPRHLYYTDKELVWQCRTVKHAAVTVGSVQYPTKSDQVPFGIFHATGSDTYHGPEGTKLRQSLWRDMLTSYTRRALTSAEDRLNAITGVANELAKLWKDECVFGLWKSRFIEELAWSVSGGVEDDSPRSRSSRAPTWSWVSTDSPILIIPGWLDEVPNTKLLLLSKDKREALVRGKILTSAQILVEVDHGIYDRSQSWGTIDVDLHEPCDVSETYFLSLGSDGDDMWALVLIHIGEEQYKRVGLATFDDQSEGILELWAAASDQDITLI